MQGIRNIRKCVYIQTWKIMRKEDILLFSNSVTQVELLERTLEMTLSASEPPDDAEKHDGSKHHDAKVHCLGSGRRGWRPEGPEPDEDEVDDAEDVVDGAEWLGDLPWAPGKVVWADDHGGVGVGRDFACQATPEKQAGREEVGRVETDDGEGDDVVEGD